MVKQTCVRFRMIVAILAITCFACLATQSVAFADESEDATLQLNSYGIGQTTGVYCGRGYNVSRDFNFDQEETSGLVINAITQIRRDAYNDSSVVWEGHTIAYYCRLMGISKEEYINVKWSNALERIAIQRVAESANSKHGAKRPNGTAANTATYEKIASDEEVQDRFNSATGTYNGNTMIERIKSEKSQYVKEWMNDHPHGDYSRYAAIINPNYTRIGAAITDGIDKKKVGVVELGKTLQGTGGNKRTKLKGTYPIDLVYTDASSAMDDLIDDSTDSTTQGDVKFCMDVTACYRMNIGTTYKFTAKAESNGVTYNVGTDWYSSDSSVISIDSNTGEAKALKAGQVDIYIGGKNGYKIPHTITVPENIEMFREYNKYDGQHLFTQDAQERDYITSVGWTFEDIGWTAPNWKKNPVYRLYNQYNGDHHYTMSTKEYDKCEKDGWTKEGVAFYSADASNGREVYRLYNPFEKVGYHHYTISSKEYNDLMNLGWQNSWVGEGVGWYALK